MADPCDNMADDIAQLIDGALAPGRIDKVQGHLESCPGCGAYYDGLVRDSQELAGFVGSLDDVVARIETQVTEKLNSNSYEQYVNVRRRTMSNDFLKMTLAAGVIILAAIIGRGYFMMRDKGEEVTIAKEPTKIEEPVVKIEEPAVVEDTGKTEDDTVVAAAPSGGMAPLPIELPKPMFVGTPTNIMVPNMEKVSGKPRPPFYAPVGCVNLAAGKVVSSTDELPIIGEIEMITDGDKEAADGSYVELGPFQQHVTIDLEKECEIYAVLIWHYHKQARVYFDVIVQTSDDADFITNVKTLFNNDIDNTAGLGIGTDKHYIETSDGRLVDGKGTRARYVRLYSNGSNDSDMNNYIEIEVWGKPVE
ncbi:MAG: zf-HC2 domain-containing protein [Planctomycetes bacterium]|nr:zf-HC2 domain-containing protein [Planctomycetota bacterium]